MQEEHDKISRKTFRGFTFGMIAGIILSAAVYFNLWVIVGTTTLDGARRHAVARYALILVPMGVVIGAIGGRVSAIRQRDREIIRREEERRLETTRKQAALDRECKSLGALLQTSKNTFLTLRQLHSSAESHLDDAEREFDEGAFAPFWDQVENATNELAAYHQALTRLQGNAVEYAKRASKLTVHVSGFDILQGGLPDPMPVAQRLTKVVRGAQKDFHFASIYEQRKTNQLLYVGFGTLATAISRMQASIAEALEGFSSSINIKLDELISTSRTQTEILEQAAGRAASDAEAQRAYERKAQDDRKRLNEMLGNIQRREGPGH